MGKPGRRKHPVSSGCTLCLAAIDLEVLAELVGVEAAITLLTRYNSPYAGHVHGDRRALRSWPQTPGSGPHNLRPSDGFYTAKTQPVVAATQLECHGWTSEADVAGSKLPLGCRCPSAPPTIVSLNAARSLTRLP